MLAGGLEDGVGDGSTKVWPVRFGRGCVEKVSYVVPFFHISAETREEEIALQRFVLKAETGLSGVVNQRYPPPMNLPLKLLGLLSSVVAQMQCRFQSP